MRVLVVEDDAGVRGLLRVVLTREGHEVAVAGDGAAGRLLLARDPVPRLLVLDRMLPDMDGADLLAGIRADDRTADLPALMLTADARESAHLDDGARTRVLAKPFDLDDFRAVCADLAG